MGTAITFTLVLLQGLVLTKNFKDNTEGHVPNKAEHSVYIFFYSTILQAIRVAGC